MTSNILIQTHQKKSMLLKTGMFYWGVFTLCLLRHHETLNLAWNRWQNCATLLCNPMFQQIWLLFLSDTTFTLAFFLALINASVYVLHLIVQLILILCNLNPVYAYRLTTTILQSKEGEASNPKRFRTSRCPLRLLQMALQDRGLAPWPSPVRALRATGSPTHGSITWRATAPSHYRNMQI